MRHSVQTLYHTSINPQRPLPLQCANAQTTTPKTLAVDMVLAMAQVGMPLQATPPYPHHPAACNWCGSEPVRGMMKTPLNTLGNPSRHTITEAGTRLTIPTRDTGLPGSCKISRLAWARQETPDPGPGKSSVLRSGRDAYAPICRQALAL
eukprot:gene24375-biopygen7396